MTMADDLKQKINPYHLLKELIKYIGDDPDREGLRETPQRIVQSFNEIYSGYWKDPAGVLKCFEEDSCDEMVILKNIQFFSFCEHHMLPFFGNAHIAYIPNGRIVGISKLARVLEIYSRRLQVQERLTEQITQALDNHLKPKGSACILEATHLCMKIRGVNQQDSTMITSSLTGVFRKPEVRQEFFNLIK